ncbi:MAG: hypothetical protein RLZ51_1895 [Pseudomonadota bacterium]|jgi:hypothetical protein
MSGGGKGGKQTQQVKIPAWLEGGARQNMARADKLAQVGYTPYFGPDVAGFTPMQQAAFQNTNDAASAFGMAAPTDAMAGMPAPQTFAGGVQGYSSAPMFQQSIDALAAQRPGQFAALNAPFIDPVTGAEPGSPFGGGAGGFSDSPAGAVQPSRGSRGGPFGRGMNLGAILGGGGDYISQSMNASPFTNFRDRIDGGGPGTSGSTFVGGPISGMLNSLGVKTAPPTSRSSGMGGGK